MKSYIILKPESMPPLPPELAEQVDVRDPKVLVAQFLQEFTREGDVVFDPFAGFGTALQVAEEMGRVPYGIEFDRRRWAYARARLRHPDHLLHGDSRRLASYSLPAFDFSISSPPFMGRHDREDPLTAYTSEGAGYESYLQGLKEVYRQVGGRMVEGGRVVILVANLKLADGLTTLAWDLAREVSSVLTFEGEVVAIPEDGFAFGYDHYYCLIFTRSGPAEPGPAEPAC